MSLKKTAVLATVILTAILLSPTCFAQGDRPVRVDTAGQGGNGQSVGQSQGNIGGFEPAKTSEIQQKETPVQSGVQQRTTIKTVVVKEGHRGHRAPYRHIKGWNPASVSFVEARDEQNLREARAFSEGLFRGAQPLTTNQHRGWQWFWWLLLLLLVWAILAAGWYFLCRLRRRPVPVECKPSGYAENRATINLGGRELADSRVAYPLRDKITRVSGAKYVRNVSAGQTGWIKIDEGTPVDPRTWGEPGEELQFRVVVRNDRRTVLSEDEVIITDSPDLGKLVYQEEKSICRINGNEPGWHLPDEMAKAVIVEGKGLRMKEAVGVVNIPNYPGGIPAGGSFALQFSMRVRDELAEQGFAGDLAQIPPEVAEKVAAERTKVETRAEPEKPSAPPRPRPKRAKKSAAEKPAKPRPEPPKPTEAATPKKTESPAGGAGKTAGEKPSGAGTSGKPNIPSFA